MKIFVLVSLPGFASVGVISVDCVTVVDSRQGMDCGGDSHGVRFQNRCGVPVQVFYKFKHKDDGWDATGRIDLRTGQTSHWAFICSGTGDVSYGSKEQ